MFQTVDGRLVYVVDIPEKPIWPVNDGGDSKLTPYANALNTAIMMGKVSKPGKYAIEIDHATGSWAIFDVIE